MLVTVESLLKTGTAGAPDDPDAGVPEEWVDFQLMKRMGWDWEQLQACPQYVRTYCLDFLQMEEEAMAKRAAKRNQANG